MFRCGIFSFCICVAILTPIDDATAFWGSEKLSPKAERAKKTLEGFDTEIENSLRDFGIPGCVLGVIVDGHVVYLKGFGYRDNEKKLPATADTEYLIGSCTKAFTAFTIGCLVDEGYFGWDDRMVDLIPNFRLIDQYVSQKLTLRDLLAHRTPLPRHDFMWYNSDLTRQDVFDRMRYLDFDSNQAEFFHYSNITYMAVGMAAEKTANKSWEELVTEKVLLPLGMKHTGFSIAEMQKHSDFALPYMERDEKIKRMNFRDFHVIAPGGGMYSNVTDLCRWAQMQLKHGEWQKKALISSATLKEMHSPQTVATGYPESKEEQVRAYGLGWYVQSYLGILNVMHDGALDGFSSVISLLPSKDIAVVILCNMNLTAWPRYVVMDAFDRVLEIPRNNWLKEGKEFLVKTREIGKESREKEDLNRKKGTSPSHSLEDYTGEYEHPGYGTIKIDCVDGILQAHYNNFIFGLEHWHYDVFNIKTESEDTFVSLKNMKLTFRNNLSGNVDELIVPFEMKTKDLVFVHKQVDSLTAIAYLRQFVGKYEIYGYTVHIKLTDKGLVAIIPGNAESELDPMGINHFSIKNFKGCWVRFTMDDKNQVLEAQLTTPYGVTYTGKKAEGASA
ncbi:MAG: CubicO group peptidase, beta-lactamase class family [Parachlamydiales bacterium]|nr:CubicO group peptidase, beta-lactamase class family [Parachlamydiales bacterium]